MEIDVPMAPEQKATIDNDARLFDAKSSALLRQLVTATPAQVHNYLANNVTTLAQARDVLEALALAVRYLYLQQQDANT